MTATVTRRSSCAGAPAPGGPAYASRRFAPWAAATQFCRSGPVIASASASNLTVWVRGDRTRPASRLRTVRSLRSARAASVLARGRLDAGTLAGAHRSSHPAAGRWPAAPSLLPHWFSRVIGHDSVTALLGWPGYCRCHPVCQFRAAQGPSGSVHRRSEPVAAAGFDRDAGDPTGVVGGEERDHVGDVGGLPDPSKRGGRYDRRLDLRAAVHPCARVGVDDAGGHCVHGDAPWT